MKTIRTHLAAIAAIWAITLAICLPVIGNFGGISPYDEITHFDYALKVSEGHLPSKVEELDEESLDEWACRITDWHENFCADTLADETDHEDFPAVGLNYNGFHPPLYYALTGLAAKAITSIVDGVSLFVAMRAMSAVWLGLGLTALYLVGTRWVRPLPALAATLLVGTTPAIASFGMMITPDAMAVLASAATIWLAWRLSEGKAGFFTAAITALFIASTKLLTVGILLILLTVWAAYAVVGKGDRRGPLLALAGGLVGTVGAALLSSYLTGPNLGLANPIAGLSTTELRGDAIDPLVRAIGQNFGLVTPYWMPSFADTTYWQTAARLFAMALTAAPFVVMWAYRHTEAEHRLAATTVLGVLSIPVVIQLREILTQGEFFPTFAPRYSMAAIPLAALCLAFLANEKKAGPWVIGGFAALSSVVAAVSVW